MHRHHDHYVYVLMRIAQNLFSQRGATDEFQTWALPKHIVVREERVLNPKDVAVGLNRDCMRFVEPVMTCSVCNGFDGYMKQKARGGVPRVPALARMRHFTLTPEEIAFCLIGGDGTPDSYKQPEAMSKYLEVLASEDWADRRKRATKTIDLSFHCAKEEWSKTKRKPFQKIRNVY